MATAQDIFAFRAQYAELCDATVKDPDIAAALNTADVFVDPSADWNGPADAQKARMLFAAHLLSLLKYQGANVRFLGAGFLDLHVGSVTIGERTVSFGPRMLGGAQSGSVDQAMLDLTIYGHLYKKLIQRNFPAVMVI